VTEVPDHLLQRSRERRAALGGESAPAAAPSGGDEGAATASTAAAVPAAAAAAAPAVVEYVPPPPPPPYVQAALDRKKLPRWMAGVGAVTLLWAFIYAGVLFSPEGAAITDPVLAEGAEVYTANCASCHGGSGQGGTGRRLAGDVFLTFPNIEDHLAFVTDGSPAQGTPYGDPDRPGGQHIARSQGFGTMPAWGGNLSDEEILAVVRYEREVLDEAPPPEGGPEEGTDQAEAEGGGAEDE
jgi:mono/diheme cytochrome c family protein